MRNTGDYKRLFKKSLAFQKVGQIGMARAVAYHISYGYARTLTSLESDYHRHWVKAAQDPTLLTPAMLDAAWSYAGLLAFKNISISNDIDTTTLLSSVSSHLTVREAAREAEPKRPDQATYRQSNNASSKRSRTAKKAEDPVAFAKKQKTSTEKSIAKAKEVRGEAKVEAEGIANKMRRKVEAHLKKKGFCMEEAKLVASKVIPYSRNQSVPWRKNADTTKIPKGEELEKLVQAAHVHLQSCSAYQTWLESTNAEQTIVEQEDDIPQAGPSNLSVPPPAQMHASIPQSPASPSQDFFEEMPSFPPEPINDFDDMPHGNFASYQDLDSNIPPGYDLPFW